MKRLLLLTLFCIQNCFAFASGDSIRVAFCTSYGDICNGFPGYYEIIDVIDSTGKIIRSDEYYKTGCNGNNYDSIFKKYTTNIYQYDNYGNVVNNIHTNFILTDSIQTTYSSTYDSLGHKLTESRTDSYPLPVRVRLFESFEYNQDSIVSDMRMEDHGTGLDTVFYKTMLYDSLMRKTNQTIYYYDIYNFNLTGLVHEYFAYDSISRLTTYISASQNSAVDSSRVLYSYNSFNSPSTVYYEQFDTISGTWKSISRTAYIYNGLQLLDSTYSISCVTPSCSDTTGYANYEYDLSGRFTYVRYYSYAGGWGGTNWVYYNSFGDTTEYGNASPTDNGCGESDRIAFDYNSSQQVTHSLETRLISCGFMFYECNYFNLGRDSMVIDVTFPSTVCAFDTVYPVVFCEGGEGPKQYHWSPGIYFSDSTIKYPYLINDTTTTYTLTVTDALGRTISDTVEVAVHPNQIQPLTISAFGVPPCPGLVRLTFTADSMNGNWDYYWQFDGDTYFEDTLIAEYSGYYSLTIYNSNCSYTSDTNLVLIIPEPLTINSIGSSSVCEGGSVILFTQDSSNYTWNTGSVSDTIVVDTSGFYYICMIDSNSCPDTSNVIYARIGTFESINLINDTSFCSGDSIRINGGYYYSYLWNDSSTLNYLFANTSGIFSLRVTDYFGCPNHDTISIIENLLPEISLGNDTLLCQNQTMLLAPGNYSSYLWQNGSTASTFTAGFAGIDTVFYVVTVSDSNYCFASDSVSVVFDICNEVNENFAIQIKSWPSPADEVLRFEFPFHSGELSIVNSLGEIVYKNQVNASIDFQTKSWPNGVYFYYWKKRAQTGGGKVLIMHE